MILYFICIKKHVFTCVLAVAILTLKVKYRSFCPKNKGHKFIKSKSCRSQKSCNNLQQKYRKDVVLVAIFCLVYLKVMDTKYRILSDRFRLSTHKSCKNKREKKYRHKCRAKFNVSYFNPGQNCSRQQYFRTFVAEP